MNQLTIKLFADGAVLDEMVAAYRSGVVKGFTTNPSLMRKAGIVDYEAFAMEAVARIPDMPISFEVFSDDFEIMEREARKIAGWGDQVYIKIPVMNARGESSIPLIRKLSAEGFSLNITAVLTVEQVEQTVAAFAPGTKNIVSVFAGRIADSGVDPMPYMKQAAAICNSAAGTELLWASSRELLNIFQAQECGCDIITCTPDILGKLPQIGKDLWQISLETVNMFAKDSKQSGYSILSAG
ncbi:transaldolase [Brevibacillus massiliensis]|uniref:transaldolase n=1 Tax=Brevibacillus massiliensis TaxID=1118054 RepID=UPI00030A778C|nr:transaldolase [Brevibacillus massiliensis]